LVCRLTDSKGFVEKRRNVDDDARPRFAIYVLPMLGLGWELRPVMDDPR
jgi:hypothetical protein